MAKLARLSKPGHFYDPDTRFRMVYGEEVPLPVSPGKMTKDWIRGGGILLRNPDPKPPKVEVVDPEVEREAKIERVRDKYTLAELRESLKENDIKFSWRALERNLAEKFVDAGLE